MSKNEYAALLEIPDLTDQKKGQLFDLLQSLRSNPDMLRQDTDHDVRYFRVSRIEAIEFHRAQNAMRESYLQDDLRRLQRLRSQERRTALIEENFARFDCVHGLLLASAFFLATYRIVIALRNELAEIETRLPGLPEDSPLALVARVIAGALAPYRDFAPGEPVRIFKGGIHHLTHRAFQSVWLIYEDYRNGGTTFRKALSQSWHKLDFIDMGDANQCRLIEALKECRLAIEGFADRTRQIRDGAFITIREALANAAEMALLNPARKPEQADEIIASLTKHEAEFAASVAKLRLERRILAVVKEKMRCELARTMATLPVLTDNLVGLGFVRIESYRDMINCLIAANYIEEIESLERLFDEMEPSIPATSI
ncbi:MAG: hypothetical protein KC777_08720 [Cyanobacteria bacterium HKST-UBA02]|nr:hypothetical protein [Cyanobacteria bacterium HKST-UBA02]